MNTLIRTVVVPLAFVVVLVVNYLANALPLGGRDTGVISDAYPNLFAPAGYAFAIWGLIYVLLGLYVVYQFFRNNDTMLVRVNRLFVVNALCNVGWLFAWHYDFILLSVILMVGLLATLIRIADIMRLSVLNRTQRMLVRLPFSVYFGWITVATIANITILLVSVRWDGFGIDESVWTVLVLLVGATIGVWRTLYDSNIPYLLVFVWAYGAIVSKHLSESGFAGTYPSIIATAGLCVALFLGTVLYLVWKGRGFRR